MLVLFLNLPDRLARVKVCKRLSQTTKVSTIKLFSLKAKLTVNYIE